MATKRYYECSSSGKGFCWFCRKECNFIFDKGNEEYFCCLICFKDNIPNFRKKAILLKKLCVKNKKIAIWEEDND